MIEVRVERDRSAVLPLTEAAVAEERSRSVFRRQLWASRTLDPEVVAPVGRSDPLARVW